MIFNKSHLLTTILTPALRVWLYSQLEQVEGLHLQITSRDEQLLRGIIPQVLVKSEFANYQGIQFDQISLTAEQIRVNIAQLLNGQPLQPLDPIPISGSVRITETHLRASLASSLLQSGLQDFLSRLFQTNSLPAFQWERLSLETNQCILQGSNCSAAARPVLIQAEITLSSPQHLLISPVTVQGIDLKPDLSAVQFDLGSQVSLEELTITPDAIFVQGNLLVQGS